MSRLTCCLPECARAHCARGYCQLHLRRVQRHGSPYLPTRTDRFWALVNFHDDHGCWLWSGALSVGGYGRSKKIQGTQEAHRISYLLTVGEIPAGMHLDHLCRVRHCVNPAHLEPVTPTENNTRSLSRSAVNSRRTQCVNGHPFDEANTYWRPDGKGRECRACWTVRRRAS